MGSKMLTFDFKLDTRDKNVGTVYLPSKNAVDTPVIIYCHGWGGNRSLYPTAEALCDKAIKEGMSTSRGSTVNYCISVIHRLYRSGSRFFCSFGFFRSSIATVLKKVFHSSRILASSSVYRTLAVSGARTIT